MKPPVKNTLVFPLADGEVLLGMKKRDFGSGWWNGFGGKLDPGETFEDGARRETFEESSLVTEKFLLVARLLFYKEADLEIVCMVYTCSDFSGTPTESEEMRPQWFPTDSLPFESMWSDDPHWLPQVLAREPDDKVFNYGIYLDTSNTFQRIETLAEEQTMGHFRV